MDRLAEQVAVFRPRIVALSDAAQLEEFRQHCSRENIVIPDVVTGDDGLRLISAADEVDIVVSGAVGAAGLLPTYTAVLAGKTVALANKESMVMAGPLVVRAARESGAQSLNAFLAFADPATLRVENPEGPLAGVPIAISLGAVALNAVTLPSKTAFGTISVTDGAEWPRRSASRARMTGVPSSPSSTLVTPRTSELATSQAMTLASSRAFGVARPRYLLPAAMVSNEKPRNLLSVSITGSRTRSMPPMASHVSGRSKASHTCATDADVVAEWVNLSLGTTSVKRIRGDGAVAPSAPGRRDLLSSGSVRNRDGALVQAACFGEVNGR